MQPFVDSLTGDISQYILGVTSSGYNVAMPEFITDIAQISKNSIKQDGEVVFASPVLETVNINVGDYIGIKLPISIYQGEVEINFGKKGAEMEALFNVEFSVDGEKWVKSTPVFNNNSTVSKVKIPAIGASYVRVINKSGVSQQAHLRKFVITSKQLDGANGNISMAQDANLESSFTLTEQPVIIENSNAEVKKITLFVNSQEGVNISLIAVDYKGKEHKLSSITTKFSETEIPIILHGKIKSFKLQSSNLVKVYEIVI